MVMLRIMICATYLVIGGILAEGYLIWNFTTAFGLIIIPLIWKLEDGIVSNRLVIPALAFILLGIAIPTKSTLFFGLLTTSLLLLESYKGKVQWTILFILAIISPLFKSFADSLSFPLRLWLTEIVAHTLSGIGEETRAMGNIIKVSGFDFYIDQACAGLNMLNISILIALFILSFKLKTTNKELSLLGYCEFIIIAVLLNMIANFFRIIGIVVFKIMPETALHDGIGLISLIIYVLVPIMLVAPYYVTAIAKIGIPKAKEGLLERSNGSIDYLNICLFIAMLYITFSYQNFAPTFKTDNAIAIEGFHKTTLANKVIKLKNSTALIYLKPCTFYSPEHNPTICWTGSGYQFNFIKKERYSGVEIYTGILVRGKERLYTSWWFDDGKTKTIDQLNWRWKGATGRQFYLINISSPKHSDLNRMIKQLLPSPLAGNS